MFFDETPMIELLNVLFECCKLPEAPTALIYLPKRSSKRIEVESMALLSFRTDTFGCDSTDKEIPVKRKIEQPILHSRWMAFL